MLNRSLLAIELVILCGPATTLLAIGILYLPAFLIMSIAGKGGSHLYALITINGIWGFISLTNLAWHVLSHTNKWPGRPIQWFGIALGVIACIAGLSTLENLEIMTFIFIAPVIATAHLLYLSKKRTPGS